MKKSVETGLNRMKTFEFVLINLKLMKDRR